mgnify:CR=1 FL=1
MTSKKKNFTTFFACFLAVSILFNFPPHPVLAKCPVRMGSLYPPDHFLVISHRGAVTRYPENTLPALQDALNVEGANSLQVDLSMTKDRKVILWHDWDPNNSLAQVRQEKGESIGKFKPSSLESGWKKKVSDLTLTEFTNHYGYEDKITHAKTDIKIPAFQNLMEWAIKQEKLKLLLLKLKIPANESGLAAVMLEEIRRTIDNLSPAPHFQLLLATPHKEILNQVRNQFDDFLFAYDREIHPEGITNYHRFTTVPAAMDYKNNFANIGLPSQNSLPSANPDPWEIYKFILTLDFRIRDNYKKATSNYIKLISWTFNDENKMRCLIHLGVDGIVTDNPKLLRRIALEVGKTLD